MSDSSAASHGQSPSSTGSQSGTEQLTTADGTPLRISLRKAEARARRRAFFLVLPLLAFLLVTFAIPIVQMISRSVRNPEVSEYLPNTASAIQNWNGQEVPPEEVFAAMAADMEVGMENRTLGRAAARINREIPGARSTVLGTARALDEMSPPYKEAFIADDDGWTNLEFWRLIKRETRTITPVYYLLAFDYEYSPSGEIVERAEYYQVYRMLFLRTAWMSLLITALCILLGYPVAHLLATLPLKTSNLLMILVLLPFWTSLLVRTSAWIVLLQQQGVVNDMLVWLGVIDTDNRVRMIYNQIGTIVAMTHILLPFMILPLYSVMKTIPPSYMRAARSLGATQLRAFVTVYMPLTIPGLAAGVLLVFILAIGYYITPALVGGDTGIFISNLIAQNMTGSTAQLRLAAALATILLVAVLVLYWAFNKLVGVDRLKFG
ncbi:ABC transporter permease [Amorphus orientalis]|uniref:Spermidine/putrescine transport system permease protein n=1 Tax=Amorphus orientalis TaxID=649198 RepID=A0AAE3VP52_9HYPH|nr:ABC transporter permease [Amorphus orientalis]MDQ0316224.1 putative spermidine/putrescine transport system permease protein [Amorphus orientalis]